MSACPHFANPYLTRPKRNHLAQDNNRTGWQQNETTLCASAQTGCTQVTQSSFGLLWQWQSPNALTGRVYAQPLAVAQVSIANCTPPSCPNLVFIATELDMLYAFNAASSSQTPVWSVNLAQTVNAHYTAVDCTNTYLQNNYPPCFQDKGNGVPAPFYNTYIGVTGTPVIDASANILYVAAAVENPTAPGGNPAVLFYLFAVDIRTGTVLAQTQISGSVAGQTATSSCATSTGGSTVNFDSDEIQRSGLLLLGSGSSAVVYVAFAPGLEGQEHGWMFGYKYTSSGGGSLSQTAVFNSTADGTGGGMWGSGAGAASDGTSIFVATGNGTFDLAAANPVDLDAGDSLLRLVPPTAPSTKMVLSDYYTPSDVFTYPATGNNGPGLCANDVDLGSGGVLLPTNFTYRGTSGGCNINGCNVVITADKQSRLYVSNQANLGGYQSNTNPCGGATNNIECITTPCASAPCTTEGAQGYWASPAYWHYNDGQDHYMLYYSATTDAQPQENALPINAYQLSTTASSGPIPTTQPPPNSTSTLFCQYSPTPSGSSNGTQAATGILWAIEHQNKNNPPKCSFQYGNNQPPAVLHAFKATDLTAQELYSSKPVATVIGPVTTFATPTVFNGRAYMGTQTEVDVFGLCSTQQGGCLP